MTQNNYELVFNTSSYVQDESASKNKLLSIITKLGGEVLLEENWGNMSTAYPIKIHKCKYYLFDYVGPAQLPEALEDMRLEKSSSFLCKSEDNVDKETAVNRKSRQTQRLADKKDSTDQNRLSIIRTWSIAYTSQKRGKNCSTT